MSNKRVLILLIFITIIGFAIRLYRLTSSPEGFYIDESSIADKSLDCPPFGIMPQVL